MLFLLYGMDLMSNILFQKNNNFFWHVLIGRSIVAAALIGLISFSFYQRMCFEEPIGVFNFIAGSMILIAGILLVITAIMLCMLLIVGFCALVNFLWTGFGKRKDS